MGREPERFKISRRFRWSIFSASWFLFFIILLIYSANNGLNELCHTPTGNNSALEPLKNEIRGLRLTRYDPAYDSRPIYSIHFESLRSENNYLGFFKTGLYKIVKIQDLELVSYQYPSDKVTAARKAAIYPVPKDITVDPIASIRSIMRKLITPEDGWRVNNLDLGNVSEVRIYNLDYKVFYDGDLFFGIRSKRATASYEHSGIVLRGHVTIKAADGSTLESNYVKWDVKKQHFSVNGAYVLNRGGVGTTGKDICVDAQLNPVGMQQAKSKQKEKKECFAKL